MKNFFADWLTFTFIIAVIWFGGRGLGYIKTEKTFEEKVRIAAMAQIEPEQIEVLKIEGMFHDPPRLESFELKAPNANLGRIKIRNLHINIKKMTFSEDVLGVNNYSLSQLVPKEAEEGRASFDLLWSDLEASISKIISDAVPKVFFNKEVGLENISGQLQLVIGSADDTDMIPVELIVEKEGFIRLKIYPNGWLLNELPESFRDQVLAEMPGHKGLGWKWSEEYLEDSIVFTGLISN
ncbi:hypothetical protein CL659_01830 [bacterium]|nr:hypothetical protein [bacterium]|tara:strand:+ start:17874 stop:18587 length:714 start_codon:yes stop_codon:yes gene_type:complete